jgi:DNA-directed RNA polymerase subunit RPC12/RpoP
MFCSKCKRDYAKGIYRCADCGKDLVDRLPQPAMHSSGAEDFEEVFSTYQQGDIFQGESSVMLIAAGAYARLLVKADEAERAREILRDLGLLSGK